MKNDCSLLIAVGELAELSDCQSLLLDVVLCEQARLACHKLLNGCRYHQVIDVVVGASRLPLLWWDNLGRTSEDIEMQITKLSNHMMNQH